MLDHALAYVAQGWPVFPCAETLIEVGRREIAGKAPLTKNGFHDATTSARDVRKAWKRRPSAAIGVPTGHAPKGCGLVVLDVDGARGLRSLTSLETTYGALPETVEQRTGSGGRQLFFVAPEGIDWRNRAGDIAPGIDTRGTKGDAPAGYVIVPPSGHPSGGTYEWIRPPWDTPDDEGVDAAEAPRWLLYLACLSATDRKLIALDDLVDDPAEWPEQVRLERDRRSKAARERARSRVAGTDQSLVERYVRSAAEGILAEIGAARHGERHDVCLTRGFRLACLCLAVPTLLDEMRARYVDACLSLAAPDEDWQAWWVERMWDGAVATGEPADLSTVGTAGNGRAEGDVPEGYMTAPAAPQAPVAPVPADPGTPDDEVWTEAARPFEPHPLPDLRDAKGLVGRIASWAWDSMPAPCAAYSNAVALGTMATLAARRYRTPHLSERIAGTGVNLYCLVTAGSSSGKSFVVGLTRTLIETVGASHRLTGNAVTAGSTLEVDVLGVTPATTWLSDEIATKLAPGRPESLQSGFRDKVMELYDKSGQTHQPRVARGNTPPPIVHPALSVFGTSTGDRWWPCVAGIGTSDGFGARWLVMDAGTPEWLTSGNLEDADGDDESFEGDYDVTKLTPPPALVEDLRRVAFGPREAKDTPYGAAAFDNPGAAPEYPLTLWSTAARKAHERMTLEMRTGDEKRTGLAGRAPLNALKVATLIGVGRDPGDVRIRREDWTAAEGIARASLHAVAVGLDLHGGQTANGGLSRAIERALDGAGTNGLTEKGLFRLPEMREARPHEAKGALEIEARSGRAVFLSIPGNGRTSKRWYHGRHWQAVVQARKVAAA